LFHRSRALPDAALRLKLNRVSGVQSASLREKFMHDTLEPLVYDLVEWIRTARPYLEVMDAWKTSCPRLPVWEEATSRGLLFCARDSGGTEWVHISEAGKKILEARQGL
jgi:hypothetical protein